MIERMAEKDKSDYTAARQKLMDMLGGIPLGRPNRQTVYLWVERKQIPHLRVMGRNIRFLRSDLEPFRAQFKQEVANGKTA
jgi:excisionase family DNA binding protein